MVLSIAIFVTQKLLFKKNGTGLAIDFQDKDVDIPSARATVKSENFVKAVFLLLLSWRK